MIHYHGGPITPERAAFQVWKGHHAFVSFAYPDQIGIASHCSQSFAIDNGAFTFWKQKKKVNWKEFYRFCDQWIYHPGCNWAVIPDIIEGEELDNDRMIKQWPFKDRGVPVWHLNESFSRFQRLCDNWPRVSLGSSGEFDVKHPKRCIERIREAFSHITNESGYLQTKIHGMRMLNTTIFTAVPLSSADSTTVARNVGLDVHWQNGIAPMSKGVRGLVLLDRIEHFNSPAKLPQKIGIMKGFGF